MHNAEQDPPGEQREHINVGQHCKIKSMEVPNIIIRNNKSNNDKRTHKIYIQW